MSRLERLKAKLQARTGPDGKPLPGYTESVEAIKAEIAKCQSA